MPHSNPFFSDIQTTDDDVGGAIGMYPNGLRVIRDIDSGLLAKIRAASEPIQIRRWVRHDGAEIAAASEYYLCSWADGRDAIERASTGIRRWRLQKALLEAAQGAGIPVVFGQRLQSIRDVPGAPVRLVFDSGTTLLCDMVFGCDGARSVTRQQLFGAAQTEPEYTGYAILMGASPLPRPPGICFLSAPTTGVQCVSRFMFVCMHADGGLTNAR
jgi:salicylate hydroxylase